LAKIEGPLNHQESLRSFGVKMGLGFSRSMSSVLNHEDSHERSSQVALMASLYTHARQVAVWLGSKAQDSNEALDCMRGSQQKITVNWYQAPYKYLTNEGF
jgi:hypothetical protein